MKWMKMCNLQEKWNLCWFFKDSHVFNNLAIILIKDSFNKVISPLAVLKDLHAKPHGFKVKEAPIKVLNQHVIYHLYGFYTCVNVYSITLCNLLLNARYHKWWGKKECWCYRENPTFLYFTTDINATSFFFRLFNSLG